MFILGVIAGTIVAIICCVFLSKAKPIDGTLHIDMSGDKKDIYRFEVNNLESLPHKRYLRIKVQTQK